MPFYQNPFTSSFEGNWVLSDRHQIPKFVVPENKGRNDSIIIVHKEGPYNLSGNDADGAAKNVLNIEFAINDFKKWNSLACTISASSLAATTPSEIVSSLNNNNAFSGWFTASMLDQFSSNSYRITIKQNNPSTNMRFYVKNNQAETVLLFNKKAGVAEIPSYFNRHSIANRFNFSDSANMLVLLNVGTSLVDAAVVNNAVNGKGESLNLNAAAPVDDYVLLTGRSGQYTFQKNTVDASDRITAVIEYHAGAKVGDLARKRTFTYTGAKKNPDQMTEIPYVLTSGDLITP